MRFILIALVAVIGCSGELPNQQPLVAVFGRYSLMDMPQPTPALCQTCGGTGVVGDGRIKMPCPTCQPQPKQEARSCLSGTCKP